MGDRPCTRTRGSFLLVMIVTAVIYLTSLTDYQLKHQTDRTDMYADQSQLYDAMSMEGLTTAAVALDTPKACQHSLEKAASLDQPDIETKAEELHKEASAQSENLKAFNGSSQEKCPTIRSMRFLNPGELPLTALASYPGSGNTWIRTLISGITGINTGDLYKDRDFNTTPGFAYRNDDTVVVVKTHHPALQWTNGSDSKAANGRQWERAVVVMRHPLDAILSFFNYRMMHSHTDVVGMGRFMYPNGTLTSDWTQWVHSQLSNWGRCLQYWINQYEGPKYLLVYEVLKAHPKEELTALNNWIGLKLDSKRLFCTLQSTLQTTFKRRNEVDKRHLYDPSMLEEAEMVLRNALEMLSTKYTHPVPLHLPDSYFKLDYWRNKSNASIQ